MRASPPADRQAPRAAAVVLSTTLGPGLLAAARSVFVQDLGAPIQLLVAVLARDGDGAALDRLRAECPDHVLLTVADPGLPPPGAPDALYAGQGMAAAALAFLANSAHVAFLDDRHRWTADHLAGLKRAIDGRSWAHSRRRLEPPSGVPLVQEIEALSPSDRPNLLMIDKQRHAAALARWARPAGVPAEGDLIQALRAGGPGGRSDAATVIAEGMPDRADAPPPATIDRPTTAGLSALLAPWHGGAGGARTIPPLRPAAIPHLPRLMDVIRPSEAIVLGAEADAVALAMALVAGRMELPILVAAVDPFLGSPDDIAVDERRAALPREDFYPLVLDRLRQAIGRLDLAERLVPVPVEPAAFLSDLADAGVRVALGHAEMATDGEEFLPDLEALWPLIAAGGAVFGRIAWPDRIGREMQIRCWAARVGATVSIAPDEGAGGQATVALRRR